MVFQEFLIDGWQEAITLVEWVDTVSEKYTAYDVAYTKYNGDKTEVYLNKKLAENKKRGDFLLEDNNWPRTNKAPGLAWEPTENIVFDQYYLELG